MTEIAIAFHDVEKTYRTRRRDVTAIGGLSFQVRRGEYVCVLGRSGCGKSTTINLVLGLLAPSAGAVEVLGADPLRDFDRLKGRIACVFQSDRLLPWRSVLDNVRLPLEILNMVESELPVLPGAWLERLDLRGVERAFPHEMSGGMRQRVAIARALVSNPDILLADEAFGHLDEVTGSKLRRDFRQLALDSGKSVLHITHSIEEALSVSDRILVLGRPGRLLADLPDIRKQTLEGRDRLKTRIFELLQQADGTLATDAAA